MADEEGPLQQLQELLHEMGGTHTLEDIQALLENGVFQSFVEEETWVVTTIDRLPAGNGDGHLPGRR